MRYALLPETLESRRLFSVVVAPGSPTGPEMANRQYVFATFTTTDPAPLKKGHYTAKLTFGDGKKGAGKITQSGDTFTVSAAHKYKQQGYFNFTVVIKDKVDKSTAAIAGTSIITSKTGAPYTDLKVNESAIFNHTYGGNFSESGLNYTNGTITATRVPDDQDEIWSQAGGIQSARVVASLSNNEEGFAYFPGASGGNYMLVFPVAGTNYNVSGSTGPIAMSGPFRLSLGSGGVAFSSNPADNPDGRDHMITYLITGLPGQSPSQRTYLQFWEDTVSSTSDFDYNDMVIEMTTNAT